MRRNVITAILGSWLFAHAWAAGVEAQTFVVGDTNCDGSVRANDLPATVFELFDGDGDLVADSGGGLFPACPGVDANADTLVTAADLTAIVLLRPILPRPSPTRPPGSPVPTATPIPGTPLPTPGGPTRTRPPTRTQTPTGRPTATPGGGPIINFFGIDLDGDGVPETPEVAGEVPVYRTNGAISDMTIIVEARPGTSGQEVGDLVFLYDPNNPLLRPDLQMQVTLPLGDGNTEVCEGSGGVPAIAPPNYAETQFISNALNDLGCNFDVRFDPEEACTTGAGDIDPKFVVGSTTTQFCYTVPPSGGFSVGETLVTVQVRDVAGGAGPQAAIIVDTGL